MSHSDELLPKRNMMLLEEVNRATSPEEYLAKLNRWATDRGFPPADEPFNFVLVMQYCEKLESAHVALAEIQGQLERLRAESAQIKANVEADGGLFWWICWWMKRPGRRSGQPGATG